jgi:hypothetical protein
LPERFFSLIFALYVANENSRGQGTILWATKKKGVFPQNLFFTILLIIFYLYVRFQQFKKQDTPNYVWKLFIEIPKNTQHFARNSHLRGENHAVFYFINQQLTINGQKYSQMTPTVCEQFKMYLSLRLSLGYSPKKGQFL